MLAPIRIFPLTESFNCASSFSNFAYVSKICCVCFTKTCPARVNEILLPFRLNKEVPSCSSSSLICLVTAGCETNKASADNDVQAVRQKQRRPRSADHAGADHAGVAIAVQDGRVVV